MSLSHLAPTLGHWFSVLACTLDARSAPRLARLFAGALVARGRRTVTRWIRAAGLSGEYRPCYTTLSAAGDRAEPIAARLARVALSPLLAGLGRIVCALDDTPTKRYGSHVEGAGIPPHPRHRR
jgi:hypothetical protein